jgi:hypothetical protein
MRHAVLAVVGHAARLMMITGGALMLLCFLADNEKPTTYRTTPR